jgi:hypothetical protein
MYNALCLGVGAQSFWGRHVCEGEFRQPTVGDERTAPAPTITGIRQKVERELLTSPRKRNLAICVLLAVATFALYSPAIWPPFIFNYEDNNYVTNNSHVLAGLVWDTASWALRSTEYSNWHPLTWPSHALDYTLYGLNPHGHHLTNVLFHMLNVVLLFLLLARANRATGRSLLIAALFAFIRLMWNPWPGSPNVRMFSVRFSSCSHSVVMAGTRLSGSSSATSCSDSQLSQWSNI